MRQSDLLYFFVKISAPIHMISIVEISCIEPVTKDLLV